MLWQNRHWKRAVQSIASMLSANCIQPGQRRSWNQGSFSLVCYWMWHFLWQLQAVFILSNTQRGFCPVPPNAGCGMEFNQIGMGIPGSNRLLHQRNYQNLCYTLMFIENQLEGSLCGSENGLTMEFFRACLWVCTTQGSDIPIRTLFWPISYFYRGKKRPTEVKWFLCSQFLRCYFQRIMYILIKDRIILMIIIKLP